MLLTTSSEHHREAERRDQSGIVELGHVGDICGGGGQHHDAVRAEHAITVPVVHDGGRLSLSP